jgi:hypothetical protein
MQTEMASRKWGHLIFRTPAPGAKGAQPLRTRSKTKVLAHRMRERWRKYRSFRNETHSTVSSPTPEYCANALPFGI